MPPKTSPLETLEFERPKKVIQVFQNWTIYDKEQNTHEQRSKLTRWNDPLETRSGHARGDAFLLDPSVAEFRQLFQVSDTLIISDFNDDMTRQHREGLNQGPSLIYSFLQLKAKPARYCIFTIGLAGAVLELHLDYADNRMMIGRPSRADYKIANLKPGAPLRVTINGKHDFSMTGRKERTFTEDDYFFLWLGDYSRFEIHSTDALRLLKPLPFLGVKHVDLKEILR